MPKWKVFGVATGIEGMSRERYVKVLTEVIKKDPRRGGQPHKGLKLLQTLGLDEPERVAELLLGTQFDGKKAVASCFRAAGLVTAHYGWNLTWKEDFSLGAYLISCLVKAELYRATRDFSQGGWPEYWLTVRDKKILDFPEIDSTISFKPFQNWVRPKDDLGNTLVKPSNPQLKETIWQPDATHFRNAYGIDEFWNPSTQKWNPQKAPHEEYTRIQPMEWVNAVHVLESVPYRINQAVLTLAIAIDDDPDKRLPEELTNFGDESEKLTRRKATERIDDLETRKEGKAITESEDEIRKMYWADYHNLVNEQRRIQSRRGSFDRTIKKAKELKEQIFYHRVFTDYRGRLYLSDNSLNYQGNNFQRGLIEFAEGRAVNESEWKFIWLHLANTWGMKGVWKQRVETAKAMTSDILRYARSPVETYDEWSQAADKWQFIRTCFEICDLLDNPEHLSHLICEVDQSTSCLQHMALVMNDLEMMKKVNIGATFSDIYQLIGDSLEFVAEVSPEHRRKIAKSALVPFGYGAGIQKIAEAYDDLDLPYLMSLQPNERFDLAQKVVEKINELLPSAGLYKQKMSELADQLLIEGKDKFYWRTASGFEVHHRKQLPVPDDQAFRPILFLRKSLEGEGRPKIAKLQAVEPSNIPDKSKLKSGLAPNFIHSIDATLIHQMLVQFKDRAPIVCVHDAIGAHASTLHEVTEMFYLKLNALYTGFNPKMYFDHDMSGSEIPILQAEKGISPEASKLLIRSQHALT